MSIESARAFAAKLKEDQYFRKSFLETGNQERAMQLVKAKGYDFTVEEIEQVRQENRAKIQENGELSDESLKQVAGGGGWCWDGWCWDV